MESPGRSTHGAGLVVWPTLQLECSALTSYRGSVGASRGTGHYCQALISRRTAAVASKFAVVRRTTVSASAVSRSAPCAVAASPRRVGTRRRDAREPRRCGRCQAVSARSPSGRMGSSHDIQLLEEHQNLLLGVEASTVGGDRHVIGSPGVGALVDPLLQLLDGLDQRSHTNIVAAGGQCPLLTESGSPCADLGLGLRYGYQIRAPGCGG